MRRHAKASTAGSTKRQAAGLGRIFRGAFAIRGASLTVDGSGAPARTGAHRPVIATASLAALSLAVLLLSAAPASAGTATNRPLLFSFDGSDTTAGAFTGLIRLGIDQETGSVYVMDSGHQVIDKFNADGTAANFSGLGTSSLNGSATPQETLELSDDADISIDNSGGANQGRIYVNRDGGPVNAFDPAGSYLWQLSRSLFGEDCGTGVDTEGHLWVGDFGHGGKAVEFANTGSPPAEIGEVDDTISNPCRLNLDASGNVYFVQWPSAKGVDKFVGGAFDLNLDSTHSQDIAIDQSSATGHVFTIHEGDFNEYESPGTKVGTFGTNLIGEGQGIAYSKALDRVYVSDRSSKTVKVFGSTVTGTVPDVTIESTSEKGISKAKFNGKINPQNVPNSYFFEWKQGTAASWTGAKSSAPQSIEPTDSADHAVSFSVTGLAGNTTYQVRLVGENTEKDLRAVSSPDTFTTAEAAAAPGVTIGVPSSVTATTAEISGTVNPQEDSGTSWQVQISTDPICASGYSDQPSHDLESEASTPVAISEEITSLISNQHYCVRISATNSFGSTTSESKEFTTEPIPPSQVFTAFAAPRTDTTARLNGRVNPEGATPLYPLTYRFEYSEDNGSTWIPLPDQEYSEGAREQIVLGEELTGLEPNATYEYRFSAENSAGSASPQGEVKSFTTRTTVEMNPPVRGYELVNNPDKGNQNVNTQIGSSVVHQPSPMSPDGETVLWNVLGGAPGGNIGTGASFLAERSANGWHSHSLISPAELQPGNGEGGGFFLDATTPDFATIIFNIGRTGLETGKIIARFRDLSQHLDVLQEYPQSINGSADSEISDDGEHFLLLNLFATPIQLEDIGSGTPKLVSVMPDGLPNECGLVGEGLSFTTRITRPGYRQMSADASRVYFSAIPNGAPCGGKHSLFERNRETGETYLIDPGTPSGREPEFLRTTPDGRLGYFLTFSNLEPADTNDGLDVYLWDEETHQSTCLTCVVPDANVHARNPGYSGSEYPQVLVSNDFSHVYFESRNVLVPGQGKEGDLNLYALSEGTIQFVADPNFSEGLLGLPRTELSADGNVLVFASGSISDSHRELTADKVASKCPRPKIEGFSEPGPCSELFRYDDRSGSLECISCKHDGTTTNSARAPALTETGDVKLSADGETIAFATAERLVRRDINRSTDLYEWRSGVTRLITDGVTSFQEGIAAPQARALSANGRDILFSVVEPGLTGFEQDGLANLYDARIGGGFEVPNPPAHCEGDSCQGPLRAAPVPLGSASAAFSGHGNVSDGKSRCRRGSVRRKGRCVKRHKRRHHMRAARANRASAK